jgi:SAM-dependent methyltransferase
VGPGRSDGLTGGMPLRPAEIPRFYEDAYAPSADDERHGRRRALSAVAKADHIVTLAGAIGRGAPTAVAEVGCGDGSVLSELGRRGFGTRRIGFEISAAATKIAAQRSEITEAVEFDGARVPAGDGEYDLAFATHVLEHVPEPAPLLREMMRVARVVVVEVPLERNLSARRPAARAASAAAGHIQRFARADVRRLVTDAGWHVRGEIVDPLGLPVHLFDRRTHAARAKGCAKWAVRRALAAWPSLGTQTVTMHYAVIATPEPGS